MVAGLAQPCPGLNGTGGLLTLARSAEAVSLAEWRAASVKVGYRLPFLSSLFILSLRVQIDRTDRRPIACAA